jgi:hypothetical protein
MLLSYILAVPLFPFVILLGIGSVVVEKMRRDAVHVGAYLVVVAICVAILWAM